MKTVHGSIMWAAIVVTGALMVATAATVYHNRSAGLPAPNAEGGTRVIQNPAIPEVVITACRLRDKATDKPDRRRVRRDVTRDRAPMARSTPSAMLQGSAGSRW
jgi:hypothetical protein